MAPQNLAEALLGARFESSQHWDPHPVVGVSSLCYAVPAATSLAVAVCILWELDRNLYTTTTAIHLVLYGVLCLLYTLVIFTSGFADFVYVRRAHRSYYGKVDIRAASATFFVSVLDFGLRASVLELFLLIFIAVGAFLFSGLSSSPGQWVVRHSLWHVVGAADATYGVLRLAPEGQHIWDRLWNYVLVINAAYAIIIACCLASWFTVPQDKRLSLWQLGAEFADWKPVPPGPRLGSPLSGRSAN